VGLARYDARQALDWSHAPLLAGQVPAKRFVSRGGTMTRFSVQRRANNQANPLSGSSLVPMLVAGVTLTLVGMIVAVLVS
jgi:hypothetical protein